MNEGVASGSSKSSHPVDVCIQCEPMISYVAKHDLFLLQWECQDSGADFVSHGKTFPPFLMVVGSEQLQSAASQLPRGLRVCPWGLLRLTSGGELCPII